MVKTTLLTRKFDVCVASFDTCLSEKTHLNKISWQYLIMDEGHRIKNENSILSQIVRLFTCRNRLLLTGTPYVSPV
jgi:SWI/SNF-related matrix-associated actin-dependent regulator of chromatin subfamily A member 5